MSHVTNVHVNSGNRQCMQHSDKNEHERIKNITCTYTDNGHYIDAKPATTPTVQCTLKALLHCESKKQDT